MGGHCLPTLRASGAGASKERAPNTPQKASNMPGLGRFAKPFLGVMILRLGFQGFTYLKTFLTDLPSLAPTNFTHLRTTFAVHHYIEGMRVSQ